MQTRKQRTKEQIERENTQREEKRARIKKSLEEGLGINQFGGFNRPNLEIVREDLGNYREGRPVTYHLGQYGGGGTIHLTEERKRRTEGVSKTITAQNLTNYDLPTETSKLYRTVRAEAMSISEFIEMVRRTFETEKERRGKESRKGDKSLVAYFTESDGKREQIFKQETGGKSSIQQKLWSLERRLKRGSEEDEKTSHRYEISPTSEMMVTLQVPRFLPFLKSKLKAQLKLSYLVGYDTEQRRQIGFDRTLEIPIPRRFKEKGYAERIDELKQMGLLR